MGKRVADMTPEERERQRVYARLYNAANRDKKAAYDAKYRQLNKDKLHAQSATKHVGRGSGDSSADT